MSLDLSTFLLELLQIGAPFELERVDRDENEAVHIYLRVDPSYRPDRFSTVHSYTDKIWRHLNIMQYECYLHCRLPMWQDKRDRKCSLMSVPWSRPNSGFTLLMEHSILQDIRRYACKKTVAEHYGLYTQRVETLYNHYTLQAFEVREAQCAQAVMIDETSTRKGHNYITTFWDANSKRLLDIRTGRSSEVIEQYVEELEQEGHHPKETIEQIVSDMSPAFIKGIKEQLPDTKITFDRFHIVQLMYRHADKVLRRGGAYAEELRRQIKELDQVWQQPDVYRASAYLCFWLDRMDDLFDLPKMTNAIRRYFDGIVQYASTKLTNGPLEGLNSVIQWIRRTARGYRSDQNLMRMIYFCFGALKQPYQPLS